MKVVYNITQFKILIKNTIDDYENMLSKNIRVIGLRDKIEKRKEKLESCLKILEAQMESSSISHNEQLKEVFCGNPDRGCRFLIPSTNKCDYIHHCLFKKTD